MSKLEQIAAIDARLKEIDAEVVRYEGIAKQAQRGDGAETAAIDEAATFEATRRRTLGDWVMGLVGRDKVDAVDAQAREAQAKAERARADRELLALGAQEVLDRTAPLHRERAELDRQRDLLVRQHVREQAELEARTYRDTALSLATSLAKIQVFAGILAQQEHLGTSKETPRHERLSFRAPAVGLLELPAAEELGPTSDAAFGTLSVAIDPRFRANGQCRASVPFEKIAAEIEQQLRAANLLR